MAQTTSTIEDELARVLEEARQLSEGQSFCHSFNNDVEALVLMRKLHAGGYPVHLADAHRCLDRIRICVQTGTYPDHLLNA